MLFRGLEGGLPTSPTQPHIATPWGELVTFAAVGTLDTRRSLPNAHSFLTGGTAWRRWSNDSVVAELLIGPYSPNLPPDVVLQECKVAVWRVQARETVIGSALSCLWNVLPTNAEGGPSSGEGLDAQTWWMDGAALSMGTEDGEYLAARAKRGHLMPARLAPECDLSTVQYLDAGLRVPFSSVEANELVQVHFIVAWATLDLHTWFAVDQSPWEILRQLGVRGDDA